MMHLLSKLRGEQNPRASAAAAAAAKRQVNKPQTIIELLLVSLLWNTPNSVE